MGAYAKGARPPSWASKWIPGVSPGKGKRQPTFPIVIACVLLFGVQAAEIFPALVNDVEDNVMQYAYELYRELQGNTSSAAKAKLELLDQLVAHVNPGQDEHAV